MDLQKLKRLAISGAASLAVAASMFVAVPQASADDHAKCQREIEKREAKLEQAVRKHGERSHQAQDRRRDLNSERERCWNAYHGWWDGHDHRWHSDRDWDHDHDHDNDDHH